MKTKIDHLVIGAPTLEQGVAYVKDQLGVDIPFGGVHATMGTHNHLMRLGKDMFLEVIAINPAGEMPGQPRWYGLDDPLVRRKIEQQPSLLGWVVNTQSIQSLLRQTCFPFGQIKQISRGDLSWYFGLPEDGRLFAAGIVPYVMQWQNDIHPANNMLDTGCQLQQLSLYHANADWLVGVLNQIGARKIVKIHSLADNAAPYIKARINTPDGVKYLSSTSKLDWADPED